MSRECASAWDVCGTNLRVSRVCAAVDRVDDANEFTLNLRSGVGRLAPQLQSGKKSYVTDELSIFRLVTA